MSKYYIKNGTEMITLSRAHEITGVAVSTISKWYRDEGVDSIFKIYGRMSKMPKWGSGARSLKKGFNKTTHCRRGTEECKHYSDCQWYRLKHAIHPVKFKADGTCYVEAKKKFYWNGDRTNSCDTLDNRCTHSG